ncbi:probable 39S ribosomal protein L45, mitochondrial [Limulus polyphemus]|uniref:Large ribosomal subunit protein mL45 n=1 Tax=Limulus polyphemus TaxID=6850 RepID=A0ABM1C4N8_LIMPO|nr:probable 39S ribosomal protein L45, mitochondrial [Limulus polyphemus]
MAPTCKTIFCFGINTTKYFWKVVGFSNAQNALCRNLFTISPIYESYLKPSFLSGIMSIRQKHWDPKFKKERSKKMIKVKLPDYEEMYQNKDLTPDEIRAKMKEKGVAPPRPWMEKPIYISCTGAIFEPYVPPEGDGKISVISTAGAKQRMTFLEKKGKSYLAIRKIRSFEDDFDVPELAEKAQTIYIEAIKALVAKNKHKVHELVTEKCYPELMYQTYRKTIRWDFIKSLEPPRVVQVRCTDVLTKDNVYAQVTVRMHSQQTLAIYDRFGRLMYGSEAVVKDVLEYVVLEKHLANQYGMWRIHGKIVPEWMPPKDPILKTFIKKDFHAEPKTDTVVPTGDVIVQKSDMSTVAV